MNTLMQYFVDACFHFLRYIPKSKTTRLQVNYLKAWETSKDILHCEFAFYVPLGILTMISAEYLLLVLLIAAGVKWCIR